ncbi:hypothetical protein JWJ90_09445 [Desulfobulbus rhabdoformis]|uniref:hypothetical protein n=1 Tax=Desulfobulbus rhabdoformis TaxID=34032 RepID=UPI00196300C5|nr:hypothetical protein [Desulfobulbus rhabdoformis]MBM9614514.1 hypothetical protein [Desulfobulbus rhabdoformis]
MINHAVLKLLVLCCILFATSVEAGEQRPFRGAVKLSVLLCKYKDSPTPPNNKQFYEDLLIKIGSGGHADYWDDVSHGSITLNGSVVKGWYTLNKTIAESQAYGGGGSADRRKKHTDCVDKAKSEGYTPPADHTVVVITSPGIDTFGFDGGAFLADDAGIGVIAHEVGHGISLQHSFSDDPNHCNAIWASKGEYDNQWDMMSYSDVWAQNLGNFGRTGPGLNAYHLDRMGWLDRNRIYRFGANGNYDETITLTALTRPGERGYITARIPFDTTDLNHYYTVEYRVPEGWDGGIPGDTVMINEVVNKKFRKCSDNSLSTNSAYRSYLIRNHTGNRLPKESINLNGVRIDLVSKDASTGKAQVRIRSTRPEYCIQGYVWREAQPDDKVCVTVARRTAVKQENTMGPSRRQPGGGAYGPDTCRQGYVWRESKPNDHVCVTPASRTKVKQENAIAWEKRIGGATYGPNTCKQGYVWREADKRDWVCVTPARRNEVKEENRLGPSRRQPGGGAWGPDTCRQGYVWRNAFPNDHTCVSTTSRTKARNENEVAHSRLANKGA